MRSFWWMMAGVSIIALLLATWLIATNCLHPQLTHHDVSTGASSKSQSRLEAADPRQVPSQSKHPKKQGATAQNPSALDDAYAMISEQGDYHALRKILVDMSPNGRFGIFYGRFFELYSRLGNSHDYHEKLAIINEFGGSRTADFQNRLLKATGRHIDAVADKAFITSLDNESWKTVVAGAVEQNANKAFNLANADIDEDHQRTACAEVTRIWLGLDSIAASQQITKMQKGTMKDAAICELVVWLAKKDGPEAAAAWIEELSDQKLRGDLTARIRKSR